MSNICQGVQTHPLVQVYSFSIQHLAFQYTHVKLFSAQREQFQTLGPFGTESLGPLGPTPFVDPHESNGDKFVDWRQPQQSTNDPTPRRVFGQVMSKKDKKLGAPEDIFDIPGNKASDSRMVLFNRMVTFSMAVVRS